jgi:hypothetical protein
MSRCAAALLILAAAVAAAPGGHPPPKTVGPVETFGVNVQRSMNLIAGSTGLKRNTVRVLFYGQSHIVSDWTRLLAERLRRQYPLVDFVIENRAISGFTAEWLVRTAEADLYSFYPDLVILHDYGDAECLERILRTLRARTTSEMILLTDHVAPRVEPKGEEITDPLRLSEPMGGKHDASWRSYVFLPAMAKKYRLELVDVRGLWKRYLADHKLNASDLLYDDLHLNADGNRLMVDIVAPHLRHRPDLAPHFDDPVRTFTIGEDRDLQWKDGKLRLEFEGNKVDLICREGAAAGGSPAAIRIDGKKPSEFPQVYGFTRTLLYEPVHRELPPVVRVRAFSPLVCEEWTMKVFDFDPVKKTFRFRISGSKTGEDGAGDSEHEFVSRSKRVAMDVIDMHYVPITIEKSNNPGATSAVIQWKSVGYFSDEFAVPEKRNPFGETVVVAAQGLLNGKHVIEIAGSPETPLAAIRVYRPPLPESHQK